MHCMISQPIATTRELFLCLRHFFVASCCILPLPLAPKRLHLYLKRYG
jgi:hypothetical protein